MAQCKYCGSETELFYNGIPVCLECVEAMNKHEPTTLERAPNRAHDEAAEKAS